MAQKTLVSSWYVQHPNILSPLGIFLDDGWPMPQPILPLLPHTALKYLRANPDQKLSVVSHVRAQWT